MNPRRRFRSNLIKLALFASLSGLLLSCETVGYYTQAARGQLAILMGREAIQDLLNDPQLSPTLREKFTTLLSIREFAEAQLALPVGRNYLTYVDVGREHVVWNVFAAPEFSVDPINWCYPIVGCVAYRGYFSEAAAQRFAQKLLADGYDVYTGGVDAYSTLGWFDDSLLSTVSSRADYQLAALLFHELAHQLVYVAGDTTFNEGFATTVEREGLRRWLLSSAQIETLALAEADRQRQQKFVELIMRYRDQLATLYAQELSEIDKRESKRQMQTQLRTRYADLKRQWGDYGGYDSWFASSLNNAQLSTVSSYNDMVPYFMNMLADSEGDLQVFYQRVAEFAELDAAARKERWSNFNSEP